MNGGQSSKYVASVLPHQVILKWRTACLVEQRPQRALGTEFHLGVEQPICLPRSVVLDDVVASGNFGDGRDLGEQGLPVFGVSESPAGTLHSKQLRGVHVECEEHFAEIALPNQTSKLKLVLDNRRRAPKCRLTGARGGVFHDEQDPRVV